MATIIALIDLGTNSIRLDIIEVSKKSYTSVHKEKLMLRMGEGLFKDGTLKKSAKKRTLEGISYLLTVCEEHSAQIGRAIGTSALRVAEDGKEFVKEIKNETGLKLEIISGKEEARLIFEGIRQDEQAKDDFSFFDIGGGSMEVGLVMDGEPTFLKSLELGASRLTQYFLADKVSEKRIAKLRDYIKDELKKARKIRGLSEDVTCLASSGTGRTLCEILKHRTGEFAIRKKPLKELINEISLMPQEELLLLPGLPEKRVDIIVSGAILLQETMKFLSADVINYTDFALRDGLISEAVC